MTGWLIYSSDESIVRKAVIRLYSLGLTEATVLYVVKLQSVPPGHFRVCI